jgi:hypothetical protein
MSVDKDPVVARALDLLVPPIAGDAEELLTRARVDAGRHRAARRRRWVAGVVFATVVVLTAAALAAGSLNLLPFLQTHDTNAARFSVDRTRVYRGASPPVLQCAVTAQREFACARTSTQQNARTYVLVARAVAQPELTRAGMLARLATAERSGVSRRQVQRVRADLAGVSDEFIRSLNLIVSISTIASDQPLAGHPQLELAPPASVPTWIACAQQSTRQFGCHNLAASAHVPARTPIYRLQPSKDWQVVKRRQGHALQVGRLLEAVLGRVPTRRESRLLVDLETPSARVSSAGASKTKRVVRPSRPSTGG